MSAGLASADKNAMPQAVCVGTWGKACEAADEADTVCVFDGFTSCFVCYGPWHTSSTRFSGRSLHAQTWPHVALMACCPASKPKQLISHQKHVHVHLSFCRANCVCHAALDCNMWQVTSTGSKATGSGPFPPSCCGLLSPLSSQCSSAPQLLLFAGLAAYMGQPCLFSSWLPCHGIGLMRLLPLLPASAKEVFIFAVKRQGCVEAHNEERRL